MQAVEGKTASVIAVQALVHPLSLAALVLLLANDFVLKSLWPGVVTGKLSDFAGLVFFPLLLAVPLGFAIRSSRTTIVVAIGVTGIWFTAIKTSTFAAAATESLAEMVIINSTIVVDPTDLVALASLFVAYTLYRRAAIGIHTPRSVEERETGSRQRRALMMSAVAVASLATVATSYPGPDPGFTDIVVDGDNVFASRGHSGGCPLRYDHVSSDGGMTWVHLTSQRMPEPSSFTETRNRGPACLPDQPNVCFRIDGSAEVEESTDGGVTWQVGWSLPPGRGAFLGRYGSTWDPYDVKGWDLVIVGPSSSTLLVAMGDDGLLRRTVDGTWTRDILGTAQPLSQPGRNLFWETLAVVGFIVVAMAGAALAAHRVVLRSVHIGRMAAVGLAALPVTALLVAGFEGTGDSLGPAFALFVGAIGALFGLSAVAAVWSRVRETNPERGRRMFLRSMAVILGAALGAYASFFAWSAGWVGHWIVAFVFAIGLATAILALGWFWVAAVEADVDDVLEPAPVDHGDAQAPTESSTAPESPQTVRSPWAAAMVLVVTLPFAVLWFLLLPILVLIGGSYVAARWTGHQRPLSRALVAIAVMVPAGLVGGALTLGLGIPTMSIVGVWVVSVVSLRAPSRRAWWARGALVVVVVVLTAVFAEIATFLVILQPLGIVGVDAFTSRLDRGQNGQR